MPLFQSESKCETILMKMTLITAFRTHFHMKGFALRLVLKQKHKRTRKWPISLSASPLAKSLSGFTLDPRVSHLTAPWGERAPGGGKMRDPGNEVAQA